MKHLLALVLAALSAPAFAACDGPAAICPTGPGTALALIADGRPVAIVTDPQDDPAVLRAADDLRGDLARVGGHDAGKGGQAIIVGTIGKDALIDGLIASGKLNVTGVKGKWEAYLQQVVDHPTPGIDRALVIAGADRRGTIFGAYDISRRAGVSPWTWWADVPVRQQASLFVLPGRRTDAPVVKYRAIFLNDEDPALKGWATATYGGLNHKFYGQLFELILRLKGNMIWPAMWGKAFYDDDPEDKATAEKYGIVIGTSHHEPLMRAHVEWERYGKGAWDYQTNAPFLRDFWRKGLERAAGGDHLVTIGMRGDGDKPMTQGTAIPLLEQIVADQRSIIADVTGKPASETPQVWALYKEVQDYYDQGMRVPDDVTLLFSDDNWGDLRRLPVFGAKPRAGGYGIYYHFDYVGGPRNYKWIDTTEIARVWEQMRLADAYGVDQLWVVNVGDLKPYEAATDFFLDLAWNPKAMTVDRLTNWHRNWASEQFGPDYGPLIGDYIDKTTLLAARRKFELRDPGTWSLTQDREDERVLADYAALDRDAHATAPKLPADAQDAYYQLVLHPVEAALNLERLYNATALNRLHAAQGRADANDLGDAAKTYFAEDAAIAKRYESRANNKWPHMMDQTHIGYTRWQEPAKNIMPALSHIDPVAGAVPGIAIEGQTQTLGAGQALRLERYGAPTVRFEIFARGDKPVKWTAKPSKPWVHVDNPAGQTDSTAPLEVSVDWSQLPPGESEAVIDVSGFGPYNEHVPLVAVNRPKPAPGSFVEAGDHVAIEAAHHAASATVAGVSWTTIPNLGRWLSAVTPLPIHPAPFKPGAGPSIDYNITLWQPGAVDLTVIASPSLDVVGKRGLRYAIAIDNEAPQVIDLDKSASEPEWAKAVADNMWQSVSHHKVAAAGAHRVRIWAIDPGVVIQRLIVARPGYTMGLLGPVESIKAQ
ncbi:MAG TPA: glycosyl hydrolase 115 family protein [Sphingomonas sp.]|uniref:glycosyl hydrolase 115 family protein n=1 Tax=Sphingomonas sp. TaxID=28214 RepID=UPI002CBF616D|nr:glycosyl hydrolase 115 family protein [Sphingomonas sp.]HMI20574.1 glycosyl hydrolase 115 family protein [Sphingomonas sp.]